MDVFTMTMYDIMDGVLKGPKTIWMYPNKADVFSIVVNHDGKCVQTWTNKRSFTLMPCGNTT